MISGAFARLGMAARIGIAIVASVAAVQVLVTLVFVLRPSGLPPFYSARWLSGAVAEIVTNARSGETEPTGALGNLQNAEGLAVRIDHGAAPFGPADPPWPLNRVLATVRNELGGVDTFPSSLPEWAHWASLLRSCRPTPSQLFRAALSALERTF